MGVYNYGSQPGVREENIGFVTRVIVERTCVMNNKTSTCVMYVTKKV